MQREEKLKALKRVLGDCRMKKDEAIFFCPKHGRKAGRTDGQLSVNLNTDWFNCWSCEFSSKNLLPILRLGDRDAFFVAYLNELEDKGLSAKKAPTKEYDPVKLPDEFISLSDESNDLTRLQALSYLRTRGLDFDDVLRFKLGYCDKGSYRGRIIIPSFDEFGELNFVVGRAFNENPRSYKHENITKDVIFNEYLIDWTKPVTIVEGFFDSVAAGFNAIPLQGNSLSEKSKLFWKLVRSEVDVYLALDTDAAKRQRACCENLLEHGVQPYQIDLRGAKDPGSMGKQAFGIAKSEAKRVGSSIELLRDRAMKVRA